MAKQDSATAKERWLEIAERAIPLMLTVAVPVAGGIWAIYVYTQSQSELEAKRTADAVEKNRARLIELQKPFIDRQFTTYNEFIRVLGDILSGQDKDPQHWREILIAYRNLHWSQLALVEDANIHTAKQRFLKALNEYSDTRAKIQDINDRLEEIENHPQDADQKRANSPPLKEQEKSKLDKEKSALEGQRGEFNLELKKLRSGLEEASVPLTTALRLSIQKSWTGDLGK